ncbi:MAG: ABC transporter substrate-binding protein [Betaproteobacteria bacterium]
MRYDKLSMVMLAAALALGAQPVDAQATKKAVPAKISDGVVKIGVLTDMTGPISDITGPGAVLAARMAVADFGGKVLGMPVELVHSDHQNKADIASTRAREWYESDKVDMITDLTNSAVALATMKIAKAHNRITVVTGAVGTRITNEDCTDTNVHFAVDTFALANSVGLAVVKQGGDKWFFLTADYTFGHSLESDTANVVNASGGKVVGSVRHPLNTADFASYLLRAQSSGANVIGLANVGADTINSIKQAAEFGLTKTATLAGLLMFISDIHSLGLRTAQGLYLTEAFYWDMDDKTRAWSKRFFETHKRMPTTSQYLAYSGVLHYLKAVRAAGTDDTAAVMAKMRSLPVDDAAIRNGKIREDGRVLFDAYLMQVKKPDESKYPYDYYHVRSKIPAEQAFQPLSKSRCPLVKK